MIAIVISRRRAFLHLRGSLPSPLSQSSHPSKFVGSRLRAMAVSASPPATPPPEPSGPGGWRFEETGAVCEWAEQYCLGGFHPVKLGDTFHSGKYRVIRKLGEGSYSTVWLAVSTEYVPLQLLLIDAFWIFSSDCVDSYQEATLCRTQDHDCKCKIIRDRIVHS